jgi:ketosteroid isomerase-like protein
MSATPEDLVLSGTDLSLSLARRWIDRLSARDIAGLNEILADDHEYSAKWRNPPEYATHYTKERFFQEIGDWTPYSKSPVTMKIISEFAHENRVVLEAESYGVMNDGYVYANSYCFMFWVEGGKIKAIHDYCCTNTARLFEDHLRSAFPGEKNLFDGLADP